ncbi:hypothetical protein QWZ03_16015 [Chitinimonas viridis]|uniref:Transposase n=1 Tax=Chitinimonas viridis TaxID=664880 RepID=A0ABT8B8Z6_9NEIS|nr:hypothetical protein [Chitinimonas viridis]MDN3578275.1 hypothetical protein [Chitinimonas viridis]
MHVGTQLIAPIGCEVLARGVVYYFLRNDAQSQRALLLEFRQKLVQASNDNRKQRGQAKPRGADCFQPIVHFLSRARFESALDEGLIVACDQQEPLPPWLNGMTPGDLRAYEQQREGRKQAHGDRIDRMLVHIWPLVQHVDEVLASPSPDAMINARAKMCDPPQNETRLRRAFFAYICFGRQRWALHYAVARIGRWNRVGTGHKFGRTPLSGSCAGYSAADEGVIAKSIEGYRRFARPGRHLTEIYRDCLKQVFGCQTRRVPGDRSEFFHPDGNPFPSFDQFIYRIRKSFSQDERWIYKFGRARCRDLLEPSRGSYAQGVANLMQETVQDGYQCEQISIGYLPGSHLPPLWVVRILCMASGMIVGIGFSWGSETASAYKAAMFCAAIGKSRFGRLFNMDIKPEDWPSVGLSPKGVYDRGPGATPKGDPENPAYRSTIKEGAPSHAGQSKASIETTHPKTVKLQGGPKFTTTNMSVPQLAMQEIRRTIAHNRSKDVSDRLNPNAIAARVDATPIGLWRYLDARGRNDAFQIPFDEAVRAFLTPIELTVQDDAVYYLSLRFSSKALAESGVLGRAHRTGRFKIKGFMLEVCLRHLWLDLGTEVIEVDAQLAIRDDEGQLYLSVGELEQLDQLRRMNQSELRPCREAAKAEAGAQFEEETGVAFGQKTVRTRRNKKYAKASLDDRRVLQPYLRPKGGRR